MFSKGHVCRNVILLCFREQTGFVLGMVGSRAMVNGSYGANLAS